MKIRTISAICMFAGSLLALSAGIDDGASAECRAATSASGRVDLSVGRSGHAKRACGIARQRWATRVRRTYGDRFTIWSAALDRTQAVVREGRSVRCIARARPCEPTVLAPPR